VIERDRRALVFGGLAVAAAVLVLRVLPWSVQRVVGAERDLMQRAARLGYTRAQLEQVGAMEDSVATLTRALGAVAPKLLSGDTPAEAGADLAARLNLIASRQEVNLERQDQRADSGAAGWLRRLVVRLAVESDIRGLTALLRGLAGGDAALSVEQVRIVASDPGAPGTTPEVLKAELTVIGWYLAGREAPTGKGDGTP
jgi:Type II secretion system (T2SS), protein M subtype b